MTKYAKATTGLESYLCFVELYHVGNKTNQLVEQLRKPISNLIYKAALVNYVGLTNELSYYMQPHLLNNLYSTYGADMQIFPNDASTYPFLREALDKLKE